MHFRRYKVLEAILVIGLIIYALKPMPLRIDAINLNTSRISPTIITNNVTIVDDGMYTLVAKEGTPTLKTLIHNDLTNDTPSFSGIELYFQLSQNVTLSLSFSKVFPGFEQVEERGYEIATLPVTINSSYFDNWTLDTAFHYNQYLYDSISFYYINAWNFTMLPTELFAHNFKDFVALHSFVGNGTYVLLGKLKPFEPYWQSSWFYIGMGMFAIQILGIATIIYLVWKWKNRELE